MTGSLRDRLLGDHLTLRSPAPFPTEGALVPMRLEWERARD